MFLQALIAEHNEKFLFPNHHLVTKYVDNHLANLARHRDVLPLMEQVVIDARNVLLVIVALNERRQEATPMLLLR